MKDASEVFARYEALRPRLPALTSEQKATLAHADRTQDISSLLDIADEADAFIFDAYGVLNVGHSPIPDAAERISQLRDHGCAIRILTNAASFDMPASIEKFAKLGITVSPDEIITSRAAALTAVKDGLWGCFAAPWDKLEDIPAPTLRLQTNQQDYDRVDGFLFLSTEIWDQAHQAMLEASLKSNPRPVLIANADLVAPRDNGLSIEPGYYGQHLVDLGFDDVQFFGKPYGKVYEMVTASLGPIAPDRIIMCGDTLHTDILGAATQNWRTVLVTQDGLFKGLEVTDYCNKSAIHPDWTLARI